MIDELLLDTASGKRSYKACPSWEHKERASIKTSTPSTQSVSSLQEINRIESEVYAPSISNHGSQQKRKAVVVIVRNAAVSSDDREAFEQVVSWAGALQSSACALDVDACAFALIGLAMLRPDMEANYSASLLENRCTADEYRNMES
ncbi:hypothetical protein NL676_027697 [Syzygium grande]|nr:hypothetical protein NL676_027697 [Syzygium grande]